MLSVNDTSVVVPPVPAPRKNKTIINGKFTVYDLFVIIPMFVICLLIMFLGKLPWWAFFVTLIAFVLLAIFLCWPMGFLGKEKIYMFIVRGLRYLIVSRRNIASEDLSKKYLKQQKQK